MKLMLLLMLTACASSLTITSIHLVNYGQVEIRLKDNNTLMFVFLKDKVFTSETPETMLAGVQKAKEWERQSIKLKNPPLTKRIPNFGPEIGHSKLYMNFIYLGGSSQIELCVTFFDPINYQKCQKLGSQNYDELIAILQNANQKLEKMKAGDQAANNLN